MAKILIDCLIVLKPTTLQRLEEFHAINTEIVVRIFPIHTRVCCNL